MAMRKSDYGTWRRLVLSLVAAVTVLASAAHAQRPQRGPSTEGTRITSRDGVSLSLTYYASTQEKDATPVVLLHDELATQGMFSSLASRLQSPSPGDENRSSAVVTVDLRGHGQSTRQRFPDGTEREVDAAKLSRGDFVAMAALDMEAVRSFLVGKNDDEKLNLNRL